MAKIEPTLFDLLDSEPGAGELERQAIEFANSPELATSDLAETINRAVGAASKQAVHDRGRTLWDVLRRIFTGVERVEVEREPCELAIDFFEVGMPPVKGAKAKFSCKAVSSGERGATIDIAGIGGGSSATRTVEAAFDEPVTQPTAHQLVYVAELVTDRFTRNGSPEGTATRVERIGADATWRSNPLQVTRGHAAGRPLNAHDLRGRNGRTVKLSVENGWNHNGDIGLHVGKVSLGVKYELSSNYRVDVSYELPGGFLYTPFHIVSPEGFAWHIESPS